MATNGKISIEYLKSNIPQTKYNNHIRYEVTQILVILQSLEKTAFVDVETSTIKVRTFSSQLLLGIF